MLYLTYEEFTNMGGTLDETAFNRYCVKACAVIDAETKCRVEAMATVPDKIKYLCYELIGYLDKAAELASSNVAGRSQSAGSVSESESYFAAKTADEQNAEMVAVISDYLSGVKDDIGTPLLYKGVMW